MLEPKIYQCITCNKIYTDNSNLNRHYNTLLHKKKINEY